MVFSFSRVTAAVSMRVEDYFQSGKRWKFSFMEKGGKHNEVFAHHNAEAYLDAYLDAAGIREGEEDSLSHNRPHAHALRSPAPSDGMLCDWSSVGRSLPGFHVQSHVPCNRHHDVT